jgi:hypothetical protein
MRWKTNLTIIRWLQLTMQNSECLNRWLNLNWQSWHKKDVRPDSWNMLQSFTVKPWPRRFFVISLKLLALMLIQYAWQNALLRS